MTTINNSSTMYAVALAGLADGAGEMKSNQGRIQQNTRERAHQQDELELMMKEAEVLKEEAKKLADEANNAGKFDKAGAVEDAGEARMAVAEVDAAMQEIQTQIEEKGKASEEAMDRLSAALKALETVVTDYQAAERGEAEIANATIK